MKLRLIYLWMLFQITSFSFHINAQRQNRENSYFHNIIKRYSNSLDSLISQYNNLENKDSLTLNNPYYFPLFSGKTFNSDLLFIKNKSPFLQEIQNNLAYIYEMKPWLVQNNLDNVKNSTIYPKKETSASTIKLADKIKNNESETDFVVSNLKIDVEKPVFWHFKNNIAFQLMQNYVSENWYKGGESNHSFLASINLQANYNNKRKVTFNNRLEAKLGFQSTNGNFIHKYRTNADLIRITNELGIKAVHNWDYSAMLQSWTQFTPSFKKNDNNVSSDFMSPFESLLSIGMRYSVTSKNNNFNLSLNISPLAGDFKYVHRLNLASSFGLPPNTHTRFEYGTNITMNAHWLVLKNVIWDCRFYYFTNYRHTQIEWENNITLRVNRFLSTRLFLYPRFDDSVKRSKKKSNFQFREFLSLGFDVNF